MGMWGLDFSSLAGDDQVQDRPVGSSRVEPEDVFQANDRQIDTGGRGCCQFPGVRALRASRAARLPMATGWCAGRDGDGEGAI